MALALAIVLNAAAAGLLLVFLAAMMRVPFKARAKPAASPAELRAHRAWLDPRPVAGRRRRERPRVEPRTGWADEAPSRA